MGCDDHAMIMIMIMTMMTNDDDDDDDDGDDEDDDDDGDVLLSIVWVCLFRTSKKSRSTQQTCFSQQERAPFVDLNFGKRSENVLFLAILTCVRAFHHNGVQFLLTSLTTDLRALYRA